MDIIMEWHVLLGGLSVLCISHLLAIRYRIEKADTYILYNVLTGAMDPICTIQYSTCIIQYCSLNNVGRFIIQYSMYDTVQYPE